MGQQQLLLLVLSAIIVGVSIVVGIGMFQDSALTANIDSVTQDNATVVSKAQEWYQKTVALGGGGGDFTANGGLNLLKLGYNTTAGDPLAMTNGNGAYTLVVTDANNITISGQTLEQDDQARFRTIATTLTMTPVTNAAAVVTTVN